MNKFINNRRKINKRMVEALILLFCIFRTQVGLKEQGNLRKEQAQMREKWIRGDMMGHLSIPCLLLLSPKNSLSPILVPQGK